MGEMCHAVFELEQVVRGPNSFVRGSRKEHDPPLEISPERASNEESCLLVGLFVVQLSSEVLHEHWLRIHNALRLFPVDFVSRNPFGMIDVYFDMSVDIVSYISNAVFSRGINIHETYSVVSVDKKVQ
jgi:hypothetical protein